VVSGNKVVVVAMGVAVAIALIYAWLILPLDLGLGLVDGYQELGDVGFGLGTTAVWLVLTSLLGWFLSRRQDRGPRRYWTAVLAASITLLTSYPLVVLFMYTALDFAMPTGQLGISVLAGRAYWYLLFAALVALVVAPVALAVLSRRNRST
jgi:peptidoglycan biosynthesis protein MviN/MurJ (putative lipid II flippase)